MDSLSVVRTLVDAWNRDDADAFSACLDPDVEFRTSGVYPGLDEVYRGHEGMRKFWADFKEMWAELAIELKDLQPLGDRVVALYRFRARGRDGLAVTRVGANVFKVEDGAIVDVSAHGSWDDALTAASP